MREWPESRIVLNLLSRVTRLRLAQTMVTGVAAGLACGAALVLVLLLNGVGARLAVLIGSAVALAGAAIAWARLDASEAASAAAVEARVPECRNVIVTSAALLRNAGPTPVEICRVVLQDAAQAAQRLDPAALLPWHRAGGRLIAAAVFFAAVFLVKAPGVTEWLPDLGTAASSAPTISDVRIIVTPPTYTGLPVDSYANPERLAALAGSRVDLRVAGGGVRMAVETADGAQTVARGDDQTFAASIMIVTDGFVAITPFDDAGAAGPRRLIGVTVTPDRPPAPRVTLPGKDMFLREATATLAITVEATDDLGLRELRLAYTKVAGVGESFTFTEGEVPLTLTRSSARHWTGAGTLPLSSLGLEVGDMVVYRAVAADARPDGRPVESDAFIIEIVSASEAMAEGFAIDDTTDKYALSQQMVILKTERLIAKAAGRPAPARDAIREEAHMIAAEQRSVRAELVFMTGGHFEDEFVEAAHEHEIAEGRLDNSGRADLGRAIRDMSRASAELTEGNLEPALEAEKAALEAMQRALSRRRFILRTLSQRESIDDTRRLTGTMADLARTRRAVADVPVSPRIAALRAALGQLGDLAGTAALTRDHADVLTGVIEGLLKAAPGDRAVIDLVAVLSKAAEAVAGGRERDGRTALADAAGRLTELLSAAAPLVLPGDDAEARRLRGALSDVRRRGGGR